MNDFIKSGVTQHIKKGIIFNDVTGSRWGFKYFESLCISVNSDLVNKFDNKHFEVCYSKMDFFHQVAEVHNDELRNGDEQEEKVRNYSGDHFIDDVNNFQDQHAQAYRIAKIIRDL